MIDEDLIKSVISVVHGSDTPRAAASRYNVLNRNTLHIATKLDYVQEEQETSLVESNIQQQIFRWVINVINFL